MSLPSNTTYVLWLEQEVQRLRATLARIAHLPYDVGHTPERDIADMKNLASEALRDVAGAA